LEDDDAFSGVLLLDSLALWPAADVDFLSTLAVV